MKKPMRLQLKKMTLSNITGGPNHRTTNNQCTAMRGRLAGLPVRRATRRTRASASARPATAATAVRPTADRRSARSVVAKKERASPFTGSPSRRVGRHSQRRGSRRSTRRSSTRSVPSEVSGSFSSRRAGVAVGVTSPRGVVRLFSVSRTGEPAGVSGLPALSFDLGPSRCLVPGAVPRSSCPTFVADRGAPPLLSFHSPSGYCRRSPQHREPSHAYGSWPVLSLSWGFGPFSGQQRKGAVRPGGSRPPAPCVLRVRPSRRLAPLRAFRSLPTGPLLGFLPSGLRSSRRSGALSSRPEPS